jgi:hypothetical protein
LFIEIDPKRFDINTPNQNKNEILMTKNGFIVIQSVAVKQGFGSFSVVSPLDFDTDANFLDIQLSSVLSLVGFNNSVCLIGIMKKPRTFFSDFFNYDIIGGTPTTARK